MLLALLLAQSPTFEKHVLDTRFVSEGVAVADVNNDRKLDILAGNVWYEAPNWAKHEIGPVTEIDPKRQYRDSFHNWAADLNGDGWQDQIVIGMPGEKAVWRENPKGKSEPWKEHLIWHSAGNESPLYVDLFKNGKRVLIMGTDDQYLGWFEPDNDPYKPWLPHRISGDKGAGSQRYSHGLGVGDLDGDGKNEVLTKDGFYRQGAEWTFVKQDLGADCAQMLVLAKGEVLSTSAHNRGVWHNRLGGGWETIDQTISVTHAANLATFNGNPNLITGKRPYAHAPGVDPGSEEPAWLVRYERKDGKWTRHLIDEASGVGNQFVVQDVDGDGKTDIAVANKNGVFLFRQR